jgi:LmbE family N-acetylglucosaminyl deacetylase
MRTRHARRVADAGAAPDRVGTLLGIWAHPDDEAYLSAGLMAKVRDAGGRVAVVTASRGELGTADPERWPPERLGRLRQRELMASLAAVGVREHYWLGYRDGELPDVPAGQAVTRIVRLLRRVRPDTVVTFGADGMTGHDDHRTVSRWVTEAWRRAASPAALWYSTVTPEFHSEWGELNDSIGLWFEGATPPLTPRSELATEIRCTDSVLDRKYRALRAHASQTRPLEDLMGTERFRRWWATESFVAARGAARSTGGMSAGGLVSAR